jgi:hypothetical protein
MTKPQGVTHIPAGFGWELRGKQLIITCKGCTRRWKADKIANPTNQNWLSEHALTHTESFEERYKRIGLND